MKIIIIDDESFFAEGIKFVLSTLDEQVQIDTCSTCSTAFELINQRCDYDIVVLGRQVPDMEAFQAIQLLSDKMPDCPVVVVSNSHENLDIRKAISFGAMGYILKASSPNIILSAFKLVLAGGIYVPPETLRAGNSNNNRNLTRVTPRNLETKESRRLGLTPRQSEVLKLLVQGNANKEIAAELNCSEATIKAHITVVLRVLGVRNRTQATWLVDKKGLYI